MTSSYAHCQKTRGALETTRESRLLTEKTRFEVESRDVIDHMEPPGVAPGPAAPDMVYSPL